MALHPSTEQKLRPAEPGGYLGWSRDPAVGVFAVLPLWLMYEALRLTLAPAERNGAEALVTDTVSLLGRHAMLVLRLLFGGAVLFAAYSIHRRQLPWGRVAMVAALEGAVYGLMLGPVTGVLTLYVLEGGALLASTGLVGDLIGSLGAGIFEETLFRLGLLSLLALGATRLCRMLAIPPWIGISVAVLASALLFSMFHHVGPGGEPFRDEVFVFRAMAGLVLGLLFVLRGFCVCVYTHAVYDIHFYLTHN